MVMSDGDLPKAYIQLIIYMGWKHFTVLYEDDTWGIGIYKTLAEEA